MIRYKWAEILGEMELGSRVNWRARARSYIAGQRPMYYVQFLRLRSILRQAHNKVGSQPELSH